MFGDPSRVNSLAPGAPSATTFDVPALSNGRENFRSPVYAMPGARRVRMKGFPSESGSSEMRFSSMICPWEPLRVSRSGDSARIWWLLPTPRP
jgi:hypothetical protein